MSLINEFKLAIKAVNCGLSVLEGKNGEMNIQTKESKRDLVTNIDIEIESVISKVLSESKYKVIGEESYVNMNNEINLKDESFWVIDPIDGTTNLVAGVPYYSIAVGLLKKLEFVLGAVVMPSQKELYFTFGDNAYLNNKKLNINSVPFDQSLNACAFSGKVKNKELRAKEYEVFGIVNDETRGCLRTGSASVNICYVASGRFQSAYGINNRIWDVCGPLAIAINAGASLFIEYLPDPSYINYVVGVPGVSDKIANILTLNKLADFKKYVRRKI